MSSSQMLWYLEHRLEFLRKRREKLRELLQGNSSTPIDYEHLREFMEVSGGIRELEELLSRSESW